MEPITARQAGDIVFHAGINLAAQEKIVRNRFGTLTITPENAVFVKGGLIGFPTEQEYCLLDYPERDGFKLLQSVNDDDMCFIVLPATGDCGYYYPEHAEELRRLVKSDQSDTVFLFVVSVGTINGERVVTYNGKAPIVLNVREKYAVQRALPYNCYDVRQSVK